MPGFPGVNSSIDFEFGDCDSLLVELEEQYSYIECTDFSLNRKEAEKLQVSHPYGSDEYWRAAAVMLGSEDVEVQISGCRVLLCGLQGGTSLELRSESIETPNSEISADEQAMLNAELIHEIRESSYQLAKLKFFHQFMKLLLAECKDILKAPMEDDLGHQVLIRLLFSVVYTIIEIVRRPPAPSDSDEWLRIHKDFKESLQYSVEYIDDLLMILVDVNSSSLAPVIPLKKTVLVIWKLTLATFGGFNEAHEKKNEKREAEGLDPIQNPADIMKQLTPVTTHIDTMVMNMGEGQIEYSAPRPRLTRDRQRNTDDLADELVEMEEEDSGHRPLTPAPTLGRGSRRPSLGSSRPSSPTNSESSLDQPLSTWTYPFLPWRPKVTLSGMDDFIRLSRTKYLDYSLRYPQTEQQLKTIVQNRFGLPKPIRQSLKVMDDYIYISLADRQRERWRDTELHQLTKPYQPEDNAIEKLYSRIWQNLSMYMISLLKLLLAAAPTANKSEIFHQDQSGPHGVQVEGVETFKLPVMLIGLDVARHKEIVTKAISGYILLLMKHFKVNHVNQFEYLSHHLYGSNCFPLIAKFFNQNMTVFVTQRNQIPKLDMRHAIRGLPIIQALIERASEHQMPHCWRNMFSSICFLRILAKIMKNKPWRVIWLVKYKATNIFKKTLLVKHGMFQLYVLKVIKLHTKFLGRQWRKTNMDVVSGIYSMVRHHLTDDWAYFNAEPDKEASANAENKLTQTCCNFNRIVYLSEDHEWAKTGHIAKFNEIRLPSNFDTKYKSWLEREVLSVNVNWDQLLQPDKTGVVFEDPQISPDVVA